MSWMGASLCSIIQVQNKEYYKSNNKRLEMAIQVVLVQLTLHLQSFVLLTSPHVLSLTYHVPF